MRLVKFLYKLKFNVVVAIITCSMERFMTRSHSIQPCSLNNPIYKTKYLWRSLFDSVNQLDHPITSRMDITRHQDEIYGKAPPQRFQGIRERVPTNEEERSPILITRTIALLASVPIPIYIILNSPRGVPRRLGNYCRSDYSHIYHPRLSLRLGNWRRSEAPMREEKGSPVPVTESWFIVHE